MKNLATLKGLRKIADTQNKELQATRKSLSQLQMASSFGYEEILKDKIIDLQSRINQLNLQMESDTAEQQEFENLHAATADCRILLNMAKEATEICTNQADVESQLKEGFVTIQSGNRTSVDTKELRKRPRQLAVSDTETKAKLKTEKSIISSERACVLCEDSAYGLMNRCEKCQNNHHFSCEPLSAGDFCSFCREIPK